MPEFPDKLNSRAQTVIESARIGGEAVPVIVRFTETRSVANFSRQAESISAHSVNWTYSSVPAIALSTDAKGIDALLAREDVAEVWYDEPVHTMLDSSVPVIGAQRCGRNLATGAKGSPWPLWTRGSTATTRTLPDASPSPKISPDSGTVQDGNGHGTHVASTVAGSGAASGGKYVGVAPGASIMAARVLGSDGGGRMSDVMAGVEWAAQNGADVINLSLGSDGNSDGKDALSTICNAAVDLGKVVVVAAGNAGPGAGTVGSPGAATKVITVGGVRRQRPHGLLQQPGSHGGWPDEARYHRPRGEDFRGPGHGHQHGPGRGRKLHHGPGHQHGHASCGRSVRPYASPRAGATARRCQKTAQGYGQEFGCGGQRSGQWARGCPGRDPGGQPWHPPAAPTPHTGSDP